MNKDKPALILLDGCLVMAANIGIENKLYQHQTKGNLYDLYKHILNQPQESYKDRVVIKKDGEKYDYPSHVSVLASLPGDDPCRPKWVGIIMVVDKMIQTYVVPEYRRKGIGQAMIDFLFEKYPEYKGVLKNYDPWGIPGYEFYAKNQINIGVYKNQQHKASKIFSVRHEEENDIPSLFGNNSTRN